jgi:3'-phosphoadenosine 5'-phosphosulfate sulfotransferase (PAPS reductase)/FAD synthetase
MDPLVPIRYDVSLSVINHKFEFLPALYFYVSFEAIEEVIELAGHFDNPWVFCCELSKDFYFRLIM